MVQKIDELNKVKTYKPRGVPFEQYFGEMEIPEEDKEKRIQLARRLESAFEFLFLLTTYYATPEDADEDFITEAFKMRYIEALASYVVIDKYVEEHIENMASNVVETTLSNLSNEWYLSDDRAIFDAENETNILMNYEDLQEAYLLGKKYKTWHTMQDRRVRHTHRLIDDKKIRIEDAFQVGNSEMMMPCDESLGADANEIVNCRCSISYS